MTRAASAAGTALRRHIVRTRFVPDSTPGPKLDGKLADRIPEVRALLRTDLPITDIAVLLGVSEPTNPNSGSANL